MRKFFQITPIVAALAVLAVAVPAFAHDGHEHRQANNSEPRSVQAESIRDRRQGKLDENRKNTCEKRVTRIIRIMENAAAQGTKNQQVFDKISERVQKFYADKGLSVANYDALVADVNAKKEAASVAIKAVQDNKTFNCDSDNPVGKIDAFNGQVRAMHQALKDYRTAIKNLIVAVKSAASKES